MPHLPPPVAWYHLISHAKALLWLRTANSDQYRWCMTMGQTDLPMEWNGVQFLMS